MFKALIFVIFFLPLIGFTAPLSSVEIRKLEAHLSTAQELLSKVEAQALPVVVNGKRLQGKVLTAEQSPDLQQAIDSLIFKILQTPRGRDFCLGQDAKSSDYVFWLGFSEEASTLARATCAEISRPPRRPRISSDAKTFGVLAVSSNIFPYESWTSVENQTLFSVWPERLLGAEEFSVDLVHELAILFDNKSELDTLWLKSLEISGQKVSFDRNACTTLNALQLPAIRFAFSSMRAEAVEREIIPKLFGDRVTKKIALSCEEGLRERVQILEKDHSFYTSQTLEMFGDESESQCDDGKIFTNDSNGIDLALAWLTGTNVLLSGKTQSACDFFTTPQLDLRNSSSTHGPRPNIGRGGE